MNKKIYEALQEELGELLVEALPTKVQIARIKEVEEELSTYEQIYNFCETILNEQLSDGDSTSIVEIKDVCDFLTRESDDNYARDDKEDGELRDYEFSIPIHRAGIDDDYPIGETLLLLRGPNGSVVSWVKIDDDEYAYAYSYLDL